MKMQFRSHKVALLALSTIVIMVGIYTTINYLYPATDDSSNALTYSSNTDVSFTFAPTLSIGLSTNSLTIDNLVPGTTNDSNTVTVTVSSNTPYGYVLSAGVGSNDTTSPYYNTSNLVHDNSTISNVFSGVDTSASLDSLDTDNTWGYSTSTNGGTSWSTYSGLSHTTAKPLLDISDPATPSTIDFKIAARSATTQASGTYNNVITFYAVGKPEPIYMQEPEVIKAKLKNVGDELQAIDQRDGKEYWVTKLADGNIWMTQNLDLELDADRTYTPADTDISANWQPTSSTIEFTGTSIIITASDYDPYSASPGELYIYTSGTNDDDSQYVSLDACQSAHPDCTTHNHAGNYYNWSATVASNNTSGITSQYREAQNSICPAGWRIPVATDRAYTPARREWNALLVTEGIMTNPTGIGYAANGFNNIRITPLWLIRSGYVAYGWLNRAGDYGGYWSNTVFNRDDAYQLSFVADGINPAVNASRSAGFPVRCLVK